MVDSVRQLLTDIAPTHGWGETWEEIEPAAAHLAGLLADYVSGATLRVDGGHIRSVH